MNEMQRTAQRYWVGVDWGVQTHSISVVNEARHEVKQLTFPATLQGLRHLQEILQEFSPVGGIAIETKRGTLFQFLRDHGYRLYHVNPKLSKQWREGSSVAGIKSDARDSLMLARELSRRHEELRPAGEIDPVTAELMGFCDRQRALIGERTARVQQLRETLRLFYPVALELFSDLTAPAAWAFLKRFSNPQALASARKETIIRFLKAHRIGLHPVWLERIERREQATAWPTSPTAAADELMMLACIGQLRVLQASLGRIEKCIAERTELLPETPILGSLPGAGKKLTPALVAIVRVARVKEEHVEGLRCKAGVAPTNQSSGQRQTIRIRRRCNKNWRNILHLFAFCSIRLCRWARAFYGLCKQRGDDHGTALRKLADKWLRIINRMIKTGQPYDEQRYVQALRTSGSPLFERLRQTGG